jgi:nitrite reductase (NO-forming)
MWTFSFVRFLSLEVLGLVIIILSIAVLFFAAKRKFELDRRYNAGFILLMLGITLYFIIPNFGPYSSLPYYLKTFGAGAGPDIPVRNLPAFFKNADRFEKVRDIARDPNDLPPAITRTENETIHVNLETKEVIAEIAPGIRYNYWTFNGTVPGPFIRVLEGDTVEVSIKNNETSLHSHNVDFHAVTGPGGGATVTTVEPGQTKNFTFKALNPGLYVYHCAYPNVATHMAHGMYGLILVEPKGGLTKVDKEFYIMQGELYAKGALGKSGLQIFDAEKMLAGSPQYIVWNGRTMGAVGNMKAATGERVRIFAGNGGVGLVSSFHVIGEIFDEVYHEGGIGGLKNKNIQSTLIPAGGSTIVEFGLEVPGKYILVDHALSRLDRGAWGTLDVSGPENKDIFDGIEDPEDKSGH